MKINKNEEEGSNEDKSKLKFIKLNLNYLQDYYQIIYFL